jgi:hypothetical protein
VPKSWTPKSPGKCLKRQLSFCPAGGQLFGTGNLRMQARKRGAPFGKLLGGQKLGGGRGRHPAVLG